MIDLLKRELPSHYKLHRTIVDVPYEIIRLGIFLSIIVIGQKFRLLIMKRI